MVNEKSIKALVKHNIKKLILKNIKNKKQQKQLINTVDETVNNLSVDELKTKGIINKIYDSIQNEHVIVGGMPKRGREEDNEVDKKKIKIKIKTKKIKIKMKLNPQEQKKLIW